MRASLSATGDDRVTSYQAAINSVAGRHYEHWPFMVEVLNRWLEANRDFVRDPLSYAASSSSPVLVSSADKDYSSTASTEDTVSQTAASAAPTPGHPQTQSPPTAADSVTLPLSSDAEAPEYAVNPSPAVSTTCTEPSDLVDPPSRLNDEGGVPVPIRGVIPLSWIGAFRLLPSLGNVGVRYLTSMIAFSSSRSWPATLTPPAPQLPTQPKTGWFRLTILANSYKEWWDILRKSFAFRSGCHP